MGFEEIKEKDSKYIAHTYSRFQTDLCGGEGAVLCSEDGRQYIDFGSGIAVNILRRERRRVEGGRYRTGQ